MLYRKGGEWALCPFKVIYTQHGQEIEQYTHDKKWWLNFEERWDHTTIHEFVEIEWSDKDKSRLEEIKRIPEGFFGECADYVKEGKFPNEVDLERGRNHPLQLLQLQKESEKQGQEISEREINEIIQGMQLSELEIRLMMGGL